MLLFVTIMVAAELTVFTGIEPKLMELGETPTPARTVAGKSRELTTNRHTHRVLFIPWQSFVFVSGALSDGEEGVPSRCSDISATA